MTVSPESRLMKAAQLSADSKIYEAVDELEALLQDDATCLQGYIQLGLLHCKVGAIAKGREYIHKALAVVTDSADKTKLTSILREQDRLDTKRLYRPDFEALNKKPNA